MRILIITILLCFLSFVSKADNINENSTIPQGLTQIDSQIYIVKTPQSLVVITGYDLLFGDIRTNVPVIKEEINMNIDYTLWILLDNERDVVRTIFNFLSGKLKD